MTQFNHNRITRLKTWNIKKCPLTCLESLLTLYLAISHPRGKAGNCLKFRLLEIQSCVLDANNFHCDPQAREKHRNKLCQYLRLWWQCKNNFEITTRRNWGKSRYARYVCVVKINPGEILVSYDVSSLFTNIPLDETIDILAHKAFENNWFNDTYDLNLTRTDLVDLLHVATKGQLFQFDGALYKQTDGVAMGSPLGPLLANVFMCSIEESLKSQGKLPESYRRYIDDTLVKMPDLVAATVFLNTLNHAHSAVSFTMEVEENGMLPFLGVQLLNRAPCVWNKGLR